MANRKIRTRCCYFLIKILGDKIDMKKSFIFRIITCLILGIGGFAAEHVAINYNNEISIALFILAYCVIGLDIVFKAIRNIFHGEIFDENFLMVVATFGALAIGEYPEAIAVMFLYQIGEEFQDIAVGKSRKAIKELMQIKPLFKKYDSYIITEKDKANENLKEKFGEKLYFLPYGTRAKLFTYIFKYLYLCLKTIYLYIRIRPKVIVTTGTHTAGPMCILGKICGSKIIYIETFANTNKKTATGRLIYPIADLFIVQWEEMLKLYPKAVYGGSIY